MRGEDPVEDARLGDAGGSARHVVVDFRVQLGEVDLGEERADVPFRERLSLCRLAPPGGIGRRFGPGRTWHGLLRVEAKADVEEGGWGRVGAGATGLRGAALRGGQQA